MPGLSVWMVRLAFAYLVTGVLAGALLLTARAVPLPVASLRPFHLEALTVGWLLQLALGVAYWILPRHAAGEPRGARAPVLLAALLLNAGLWLVVLAPAPGGASLAGRLFELAAVLLFALHAWPRVKPFGR